MQAAPWECASHTLSCLSACIASALALLVWSIRAYAVCRLPACHLCGEMDEGLPVGPRRSQRCPCLQWRVALQPHSQVNRWSCLPACSTHGAVPRTWWA